MDRVLTLPPQFWTATIAPSRHAYSDRDSPNRRLFAATRRAALERLPVGNAGGRDHRGGTRRIRRAAHSLLEGRRTIVLRAAHLYWCPGLAAFSGANRVSATASVWSDACGATRHHGRSESLAVGNDEQPAYSRDVLRADGLLRLLLRDGAAKFQKRRRGHGRRLKSLPVFIRDRSAPRTSVS